MTKNRLILLNKLFEAAVAAADPRHCLAANLPTRPKGRTVVLGAGKAAASMARAVEEQWPADVEGLVVTRYGHVVPTDRIEVVQAAHPVPDAASEQAAFRIRAMAETLGEYDGAQASFGHKGRLVGCSGRAGACGQSADFRRAGRRPCNYSFGPNGC